MTSDIGIRLAKRLKALREDRGWTQEDAARKCKMEYKYYQRYESKNPRDMRLSTLEKIAKAFGMESNDLITFK
jgi:transcriptional regulator with XRE-family HTH domain